MFLGPMGEWHGFVLEWTSFGGVARPISVCFDEHGGATLEGIRWTPSGMGTYQSEGTSPKHLHLLRLGDEVVGGRAGDGGIEAEIYLVPVRTGACGRPTFSERNEILFVMGLCVLGAIAFLQAKGSTAPLFALGCVVGGALFLRNNIQTRRNLALKGWALLFLAVAEARRARTAQAAATAFGT